MAKVHCKFHQVKVGASFECNGNMVRKQSTRTGLIVAVGKWFYYGKNEVVTVAHLDNVNLGAPN